MSQVKRQKADVVPLELVRTLSVVGGCRMNPEIEVKALYESRGVFRGIQHFTASPTASNTLIIFVILIEGNSEFGFLLYTEIPVERTWRMLSLSQKRLLCTETAVARNRKQHPLLLSL